MTRRGHIDGWFWLALVLVLIGCSVCRGEGIFGDRKPKQRQACPYGELMPPKLPRSPKPWAWHPFDDGIEWNEMVLVLEEFLEQLWYGHGSTFEK